MGQTLKKSTNQKGNYNAHNCDNKTTRHQIILFSFNLTQFVAHGPKQKINRLPKNWIGVRRERPDYNPQNTDHKKCARRNGQPFCIKYLRMQG